MYRAYVRQLKSQNPGVLDQNNVSHEHAGVECAARNNDNIGNNGIKDVISRILRGDPEAALHAGKKKAIRLFVSSTFTDTKAERNYLMRETYPQIRQLCQNYGVEFSIVDLRWGIRDTATNDHMTSEICLSEIEKCMTSSLPGAPCFMYLSFNRYGAAQLPRLVPAAEMEPIMLLMEGQEVLKDVGKWYLKDENACPPVYVLQPISTYMPEFLTTQDMARRKELRNEWYRLSDGMMRALRETAVKCTELTDQQRMKWQISTTHHEVVNGLLKSHTAREQGVCYIRNIRQFLNMETVEEDHGNLVWRFIDLNSTGRKIDGDKKLRLKELQRLVKDRGVPCTEFECDWDPNGIEETTHFDHVKSFADTVHKDLHNKITKAISKVPKFDSCVSEVASHVAFCEKKGRTFQGRDDLLDAVMKHYYESFNVSVCKFDQSTEHPGELQRQMFVVHGISGSGKTFLMAKLVSETQDRMKSLGKIAVFVTRFCGTSPMSSSARGLLQSMSEQIARAYSSNPESEMLDVPTDFESLIVYFDKCLKNATEDQPLVIHIDSLDQLSDEDNARRKLSWLPTVVPDNVYLTVSTLPETGGCLVALRSMNIPHVNFIEVPSLSGTDSQGILQGWLVSANKNLTEPQLNYVKAVSLDESEENPTTLRLRLLFDIASTWTSYQEIPPMPCTVKGLINMIFDNLEKKHGKALVSCFCGLIGVSRLGLPENDLIDILSTDDEVLNSVLQYHKPPIPRIPYHVFARLRNDLGDYIIERGAHGRSVLYWYHRQFWETSGQRFFSTKKTDQERYASLIGKYYSEEAHRMHPDRGLTAQPLYWTGSKNECTFNVTKLSELPNAVSKASVEDTGLYKVIDLTFIAAKCSVGLAREMLSDFITSSLHSVDSDVRYFLSHLWLMFNQNVHILEKEPQLILQQIANLSEISEQFESTLASVNLKSVLPWIPENQLYAKCILVNKPVGSSPSIMTFFAEKFKGKIKGLDVLKMGTCSIKRIAVVGTTHKFYERQLLYEGRLDVYDVGAGVCFLSVSCDHAVELVKLLRHSDDEFWIIYSSRDRLIRTVRVSLDEEPTATRSVSLNLETKVLHSELSNYDVGKSEIFARNNFAVSHRDGRVAATSYGQIGSRRMKQFGSLYRRYFHCVFKMWNVADAEPVWLKDQSCDPSPMVEIEPVLATLVNSDITDHKKNYDPEGYYIGALSFSPDDRFIVMVLIAEDEGETLSPFMSICDSETMEPLWTLNNVEGKNLEQAIDFDLKRWISCLDSGNGILFIVYASRSTLTCIAFDSKNPNSVQGKRIWGERRNKRVVEATFCQISTRPDKKAFIICRNGKMEMQYAPEIELGDPANWNDEEAEFCRSIVPTKDETIPPVSLPQPGERIAMSDIGSDIERMHVDNRGFALTISEAGKLKVTDLTKYCQYKLPEQHEYAIESCCLSRDKKFVFTKHSKTGDIGIWDATSGAKIDIQKRNEVAEDDDEVLTIECKELLADMRHVGIHFFALNDLEMCISVDEKLFCTSHPKRQSSHIAIGLLQDGLPCHPHKVYDMPTYKANGPGLDEMWPGPGMFDGTYKSRFSSNGKYIAAFGVFYKPTYGSLKETTEWPPQIKLFEVIKWDELNELSLYRVVPEDYNTRGGFYRDPDPDGCTTLTFLPDNKNLVSATYNGVVKLHNIPDLEVTASIRTHTGSVSGIHAVSSSKGTFVLTCSLDHWIKVIRVQPQNLSVVALYYNAVALLCITGFIDPDDVLYIHAGDTGGLLSVIKVDLKALAKNNT